MSTRIEQRNRKIVELKLGGVSHKEIARKFELSRGSIDIIVRRASDAQARAARGAELLDEIQQANDLDRQWAVEDLLDVIEPIAVTKNMLHRHFQNAGLERVSLRAILDLVISVFDDPWDGRPVIPLYKVPGIGGKGFKSVVDRLSKLDLGERFNREWERRLTRARPGWRINNARPPGTAVAMVVGIDLSGPSNIADTSVVVFSTREDGLRFRADLAGADDMAIFNLLRDQNDPDGATVVGIDAPLSYNPGGGDRPADKVLRSRLIYLGMKPGCVMAPTMTRMAYLTLRGISLARTLAMTGDNLRIVEVHPGAALALRDAPIEHVRDMRHSASSRRILMEWLATQGLAALAAPEDCPSHFVAACAAALAAWDWARGKSRWLHRATLPLHPFDFAC